MTVGDLVLVHPWDYCIIKGASKFEVINGADSRIVHETTDLTDALTAFTYCRDQMTNLGKSTVVKGSGSTNLFPMSDKVVLNSNDNYQYWRGITGPRGYGTQIRASNNTPIFELTDAAVFNTFEDLYFTHNNASYSSSMIRFLDRAIGNQINGCVFYDFTQYKGYCIGMEILGTGSGLTQYKNHIRNCESNGFEAFKYMNHQKVSSGSDYFISNNSVVDTDIWNAKHCIKIDGIPQAQILHEVWDNVTYQYSASNPLSSGEAAFKLDGGTGAYLWQWIFDKVMVWDLPAGANYANVPSSCELFMINCQPSHKLGGNSIGIAKTVAFDYYSYKRGTHNQAGIYNQRDYPITHSLGLVPKYVFVTVTNNDTNAILYCTVPKTLITTTQFTVRFPKPPPIPNRAGVLNLDFSWEVIY